MKGLTETDYKYLAGLLDADGWCSFNFCTSVSTGKTYLQFRIGIACSSKIDKNGEFISWISSFCGRKSEYKDPKSVDVYVWQLGKREELNSFVPRVIKHMIIKAKHFKRLFDYYSDFKGKDLTGDQIQMLKEISMESRKDTGPLKSKNFPSKAWTAGYLDGDGHYGIHKRKKDNYHRLSIDVLSDKQDIIGLEMLQKTYGGNISTLKCNNYNPRWYRGLGKQHRAFAIDFLKTMHRHSRLKRNKIEQMLSFHNYSRND